MAGIGSSSSHIRRFSVQRPTFLPNSCVTIRYGSVIVTHLLRDPEVSSSIASLVLVDPVSILLHLPDVAYNFVSQAAHISVSPPSLLVSQLPYLSSPSCCSLD